MSNPFSIFNHSLPCKETDHPLTSISQASNPGEVIQPVITTNLLSDSMIVVNNKLAKEALANAIASGRVNPNSSPQAYLLQSLIHLNFVFEVRKAPGLIFPADPSLEEWSCTEITVADTVLWLFAFLETVNCRNIEQLLRDVASYRSRHPDYPKGQWPYMKGSR